VVFTVGHTDDEETKFHRISQPFWKSEFDIKVVTKKKKNITHLNC